VDKEDVIKAIFCICLGVAFFAWKFGFFKSSSNINVNQPKQSAPYQQQNTKRNADVDEASNNHEKAKEARNDVDDVSKRLEKAQDAQIETQNDIKKHEKYMETQKEKEKEFKKTQDALYGK
jgi:hypothetical protein